MDSFYDFEMDKNAVQKLIDVKSARISFEVYAGKSAVWKNFVLLNVYGVVGYGYGQGFVLSSRVGMGMGGEWVQCLYLCSSLKSTDILLTVPEIQSQKL